jgi:hypothetical protein
MQEKPGRQGAADGLAATQKLKDSKVYTEVKEFSLEINLFFFHAGDQIRASHLLGKGSTIELHSQTWRHS